MAVPFKSAFIVIALFALGSSLPALAQDAQQPTEQSLPGTIIGTVVDASGALVPGAHVELVRQDLTTAQPPPSETLTDAAGQFSFPNVAPGPFDLTITSPGFATQTSSGTLQPGEIHNILQITLAIAEAATEVQVVLPRVEIAEDEIKVEERQRVLSIFPNFYVTYVPDAVPLDTKQKFELAWKTMIDPVSFAVVGVAAGIQQASDQFSGYGQGAQGYAKRYGASYADFVSGTLIGSAILPSILKQDPRYFYKGTGTVHFRTMYALANSVICKGDNGHWQPNYSNILGNLAAGGISNLYYPPQNRGAALTFENAFIGVASTGAVNLFEEFLVRKLTPKR